MSLQDKKVLVGLTGGIACYKVPYLLRDLVRQGAEVRVIMTKSATKFITPLTLETVSGHPVAVDMFPEGEFVGTRHIDLANWPDLVVIAPATANFFGKIASGVTDDLLTTVVIASPKPVMVAPAMNPQMWRHPTTQRNAAYFKEIGYQVVGPAEGDMACDHVGVGRMVEPGDIMTAIEGVSGKKKSVASKQTAETLRGKNILITAGPCREPIDPVRYISNRSSGKMGYALAEAAAELGATVTLVSGPSRLSAPNGVDFVSVETTDQMYEAVSQRFSDIDCLIMAAAPADFAPSEAAVHKIKKQQAEMQLSLSPTVDILKAMGERKKDGQVLIGFALETDNAVANARKKLESKNLDMIVLNNPLDANSAFDHDTNKVTIILPEGEPEEWPLEDKAQVAFKLLEKISRIA